MSLWCCNMTAVICKKVKLCHLCTKHLFLPLSKSNVDDTMFILTTSSFEFVTFLHFGLQTSRHNTPIVVSSDKQVPEKNNTIKNTNISHPQCEG